MLLEPRVHVSLTPATATQAHTHGSPPFHIMDVQGAEIPCKGVFSLAPTKEIWAEVKFRMFGFVLIPRLKPIPLPWFVDPLS